MVHFSNYLRVFVILALAVFTLPIVADATPIQVGRYITIQEAPTREHGDVLANSVAHEFAPDVVTVADAIEVVLRPLGYALATSATSNQRLGSVLSRPLQKQFRSLGPRSSREYLRILIGVDWQLVEDPDERLVSFVECEESQ